MPINCVITSYIERRCVSSLQLSDWPEWEFYHKGAGGGVYWVVPFTLKCEPQLTIPCRFIEARADYVANDDGRLSEVTQ